MPHRLLSGPIEIMLSAFTAMLAAAGGIDDLASPAIWDKSQLRIFCILGSLAGAFLSIALFPPKDGGTNMQRKLAIKFLASGICGVLFTPMFIRWMGLKVDVDSVLCISGIVAISGVSIVSSIMPAIERRFVTKISSELPLPPEKPPTSPTP